MFFPFSIPKFPFKVNPALPLKNVFGFIIIMRSCLICEQKGFPTRFLFFTIMSLSTPMITTTQIYKPQFVYIFWIHSCARTKNLVSLPKMAVVFTILKNRTWSYQLWKLVSVTLTKTVRHLSQCRIMSIILNIFQCLSKQNSHFIIHAYQVILNKWWKLIRVIRRNLKG